MMLRSSLLLLFGSSSLSSYVVTDDSFPWLDPSLPVSERVDALLSEVTDEELVAQLNTDAPSIDRLKIPAYSWWSEAAHGVGWAGQATVFPAGPGLAATFDTKKLHAAGVAMGREGRAKHNDDVRASEDGSTSMFQGLNFFAPNLNLVRDPRWGRAQETFGEDPYLTGTLGASLIAGMQTEGDDGIPLAAATSKHFFVYNIESDFAMGGTDPQARLKINVNVTDADLRQTYLPIFSKTTSPHETKSPARSIMCSYNAINGIPACGHPYLRQYLRDELEFRGFIVSDCGAIGWMGLGYHNYTSSDAESAKVGIEAGTDLCCGDEYNSVDAAAVDREKLEAAFRNLFTARIELGMLDPFESVSWSSLTAENDVDTPGNRQLARELAQESIVLLKNDGLLPLSDGGGGSGGSGGSGDTPVRVALIGPNANRSETLLSNYAGCKASPGDLTIDERCTIVNPYLAFEAMGGVEVDFEQGVDIDTDRTDGIDPARAIASQADVAVVVVGLITCQETGDQCQEAEALDRVSISLPGQQQALIDAVAQTGTPTIVVVMSGGTVAIPQIAENGNVTAILQAFYGGEEMGNALTDVLFGKVNPSGKLPVTIFSSLSDLPEDYLSVEMLDTPGRTGRYFTGEPLFAFGFGLSYSKREYSSLSAVLSDNALSISINVEQLSGMGGDETVQCYVSYEGTEGVSVPKRNLVAFDRIMLETGQRKEVKFEVNAKELELMGADGEMQVLRGDYVLSCGGAAPGSQGKGVMKGDELGVVDFAFTV